MSDFVFFFNEYGQLIHTIIYVIVGLILLFKTGDKKILKEVCDTMKYRTEHYKSDSEHCETGQTFSNEKDVYRLNKVTGELEVTGEKIDIKELINSALPTLVESAIKRFLPNEEPSTSEVEINTMSDDLDFIRETFNVAEHYRERYNLPVDYSIQQIFDFINQKKSQLESDINAKIDNLKTIQINSEVLKNENA